MKKAVIYSRVSTEDQKDFGFSLQDQEARLIKHCKQKDYQLIKHYQDDHSAKNFNRPAFKQFLDDIRTKRIKPDVFLCVRMDRFSRNAHDSMNMLKEFQKWGIYFECIENHIDLSSPESMIPFMLNLVLPEVDNKRRGLNTKRGLRQGLKEGRWMWKAPVGYLNDTVSKIIMPNKETAHLVKWSFETYVQGVYNANEVWRQVYAKGLKISKQKFYDLLINPIYIGKIRIDAFEDEPEQIVNAIHEPIVQEETFYRAQEIYYGKKKPYKSKTNKNELPLIGHVICPKCGRVMTGSGSTGRAGGLYHYYHCQRKYGCKTNIRANEVNENFTRYLSSFEVSDEVLSLYYYVLEDVFKSDDKAREQEKAKLESEITSIDKRLESVRMKFIDDLIGSADYKEIKSALESRKNELLGKHIIIGKMDKEFTKYMTYGLSLLGNLSKYYSSASTEAKSKMVGSIFPENLTYEDKRYRTTKFNEVFALICNTDKAFRKQKPGSVAGLSRVAPAAGLEPATL
ncbi:MAG: recombinase family protein [Chitinophagaceae bacterium]